ncbi:MAG: putative porin, partial [Acidobacteriales bacterium]|nr:putative porin [Terriglobales bacterium]
MRRLIRLGLILALVCATSVQVQKQSPQKAPATPPLALSRAEGAAQETPALKAELAELKQMLLEQARELRDTRAALRAQQEKVEAIERQFQEQISASQAAQETAAKNSSELNVVAGQLGVVAQNTSDLQKKVSTVQSDLVAAGRTADGRFRQFGNFRFSGDFRFRYEPFLQAQQTTRQRQRVRARLNLTGNLTDELYGGITIASGSLDDPISTNQTLTNFFNRKTVGFDRI